MQSYKDYMLYSKLPHTWCAGCGHGVILHMLAEAFNSLELEKTQIALVSGIGCFGRVDDYLDVNCLHVTHGRALPTATGVALANPDLTVLATMGDGDGVTIGGNHLIHAARRNVNITAIISNNFNYGQTGGQYSATTPENCITTTSPYGHIEDNFDICRLVEAAGASYVARSTSAHPQQLKTLIIEGLRHKGFSLIEVITPCPTHFGRLNASGSASKMLKSIKDRCVSPKQAKEMNEEELADKIIIGCLVNQERDDYITRYRRMVDMHIAGGTI